MTLTTAFSVLRNRAAVAEELRRLLPKMEGVRAAPPIPFGLAAIDRCLPQGGLAGGALHEIVPEEGATPAAFGFLAALLARLPLRRMFESDTHSECSLPPCGEGLGKGVADSKLTSLTPLPGVPVAQARWDDPIPPPTSLHSGARERGPGGGRDQTRRSPFILVLPAYGLRDYGRPHGHGLHALGLDPRRLILVETTNRKDTLWAMEEALHSRAVAAVAGAIDQLDLKTSQRLQLAAMDAGLPLFVLRPAEILASSAAATRWRVAAAPAARDRFGVIAHARWQLMLERCRNGRSGEWMVEYDHVAHRFSLAAALADPAFPRGAGEKALRQAG